MTIEIKENRRFARFWFVGCEGFDWLCALWRDPGDRSRWTATYRFRYYRDDGSDPHFDDDKSWWTATFPLDASEVDAEAACDFIAQDVRQTLISRLGPNADVETESIHIHSDDVDVVSRIVMNQRWCHPTTSARGGEA